jgi:hypothetical protein
LFTPPVCAGHLPRSLHKIIESLSVYQRWETVVVVTTWGLTPRSSRDFVEIGQGIKLGIHIKERIVRVLPDQQNRRRLG